MVFPQRLQHLFEEELQLVGLSFGSGGVPYFGGRDVEGQRRGGRGEELLAAAGGLQSVSHH